jgi:4-hydroxy-2-oxoheptanedioate aldolase
VAQAIGSDSWKREKLMAPSNNGAPSLAQRLRDRTLTVGLIVKMPNAALIEAAGLAGFDLIVIDTEHGINDGEQLEHHLRAASGVVIPTLVRVGANTSIEILRVLDAGATGVIVPHVDTIPDAVSAARSAHYPPAGTRGLAVSTRAGGQGTVSLADHLDHARRETVMMAQLEDKKVIPIAGAIASTPNVNAVWLGPSDLSMSLGHPGDLQHPVVAHAIDDIVNQVVSTDQAALCVIAGHEDEIPYRQTRGATVVLFASPNLIAARLKQVTARSKQSQAESVA